MADLTQFSSARTIQPTDAVPTTPVRRTTSYTFTGTVLLADISGSMAEVMRDGKTRHQTLRDALLDVHKPGMRLVAFSDSCTELASPSRLPNPRGGTDLHKAIDHVVRPAPTTVIVITDGAVSQEPACMLAVDRLPPRCVVRALFVGDESNHRAIDFLRRLCAARGGDVQVRDLAKLLPAQSGQATVATAIRGLLA